MRTKLLVLTMMLAGGMTACGYTLEDYERDLEAAKSCDGEDSCVLAGFNRQCTCHTAVNAERAEEVQMWADNVNCSNVRIKCATLINPRCERGTCIADFDSSTD